MCGIAGCVRTTELEPERIEACLEAMRRRGPDARGAYHHEPAPGRHVHLLASRLQIIDLDPRANQPFRLGTHVLSYNGELYNYVELRERLRTPLRTESDTEVLAATLAERGADALADCEGMWAFALYDERDGSLLLSRDRFGEKPLYLYRDECGLYFGSEVKFLAALLGRRIDVNLDQLYRYLVNGYKSLYKRPETFFVGVSELAPGTVLRVGSDGRTSERYWRPSFDQDDSLSYEAAVEAVRERLIDSVRLRLRADTPLAFCMSGGVDSNALISIARRVFDYDVHGFTIVNTDARYEEWTEVEHAVSELGIRHTAVPPTTERFVENLREIVRYHDAPIYTISYYVQWLLMARIAEAGYRVSVSGTAADELLTGYYDHHNLYLYEVRESELLEPALAAWEEHVRPWVRNPYLQRPRLYFDDPGVRDHVYLNRERFLGYLRADWDEGFEEALYTTDLLRNRMLNELFHEAVPPILHEDDLNAMYFSIENRSPYLDSRLFDLCRRVPSRHLIRDGYAKALLRDAMAGIVPERIVRNHRKVGFNAPLLDFLDVRDPEQRSWVLDGSPIYEHVRREAVEELLGKERLENSESKFLFNVVCAKAFLEEQPAAP